GRGTGPGGGGQAAGGELHPARAGLGPGRMKGFGELYPEIGRLPPLESGDVVYREPLPGGVSGAKNTPAYNVHSYPTKVPPEAIEPFVEHHTAPGAWVLDPFCGSGMTGLAARRAGRRAILGDLSPGAAHLAWNLTHHCDAAELAAAGSSVLEACAGYLDRLYAVEGRDGEPAHLGWTLFSQQVAC